MTDHVAVDSETMHRNGVDRRFRNVLIHTPDITVLISPCYVWKKKNGETRTQRYALAHDPSVFESTIKREISDMDTLARNVSASKRPYPVLTIYNADKLTMRRYF